MSASPITLTIIAGGVLAFRLDEAGEMLAPESTVDRLGVLSALAQAAALLAAQPLEDDPADRGARIAEALGEVGSPAALEALEDLRQAAEAQTDALRAAGDIIAAALPTPH